MTWQFLTGEISELYATAPWWGDILITIALLGFVFGHSHSHCCNNK